MSRGWLIVFAKAPRPGLVKTRMAPPLDLDQAAALYEAMLDDVLAASERFAEALDLEPVLAFHPADAEVELRARAPASYRMLLQRGAGLGERMANAFAEARAAGAPFALLRGSDSPALDLTQIEAASLHLRGEKDVVFTPDGGGGYAMIGLRGVAPRLFEVEMSTPDMLDETLALARSLGLGVARTPPSFDLDRAEDLASLSQLPAQRASDLCPLTVQSISRLRSDGVL